MNDFDLVQIAHDAEWNKKRLELQEALLQAANELTTFTRASRMEMRVNGIRVIVQVETFDRTKMQ
jgi:hypothetical protein